MYAYASKEDRQDFMGEFTVFDPNDIEFTSNRRLNREQQMEVGMQLLEDYMRMSDMQDKSKRKTKKKSKRKSNNDFSERVLPSGIIQVSPNDPFDQNAISPDTLVPALNPMFNMP